MSAAPPASPAKPEPASRFVTLPKAEVQVRGAAPVSVYEMRTLEGCPVQTLNVPLYSTGRVATFTAYRGNPNVNENGQLVGPVQHGNRQSLTEAEVQDIHAYVKSHVCATNRGAAGVYPAGDQVLRGMSNIRPLAEFLSMELIPAEALAAAVAKPVSMAG